MIPASQLTSLGIGIGIAVSILVLVRKNHLMVSHAVWWLTVAAASMAFGAYPQLIDRIGSVLGIHYPPTLLIVIGMGFILIKMLTIDLKRSEQERQIRARTQRMAVLESELYDVGLSRQDSTAGSISDSIP
jgi:hypothetical protein